MTSKTTIKLVLNFLLTLVFVSCGSAQKSFFSRSDAKKEVRQTFKIMKKARKEQVDLLAHEEYLKARTLYLEAKNSWADGDEPEDIIQTANEAKAQFQVAQKMADSKKDKAQRILRARKAALKAGAMKPKQLRASMEDIDEDLREETDLFTTPLEPEEFSEFQKKYLHVEAQAVQKTQLGKVREAISSAKENDGAERAPKSFREATLDLKEAENIILRSPRNRRVYGKRVKTSKASAQLLTDVLKAIAQGGEGTSESVALKIVNQEKKLGSLNSNLGKLKGDLSTAQSSLDKVHTKLVAKKAELNKAAVHMRFQEAMDNVRKNFSKDEAAVYQQGRRLIIRLKKVNFAPGRSDIPSEAIGLLSKVGKIIEAMDPASVLVQGHTDSTGSSRANQSLSAKRARAVATYLGAHGGGDNIVSKGYGESRPIAPNKTRKGRSLNRRVDIVVRAHDHSSGQQIKLTDGSR